nr:ABC transporter permease [Limnohabitans sp. Jir72]
MPAVLNLVLSATVPSALSSAITSSLPVTPQHKIARPLAPARSRVWLQGLRAWAVDWLLAWVVPLLLLGLWALSSHHEWIALQVLPSPQQVWATLVDLTRSGELLDNLQISAVRVLYGFGIGASVGLALGVALGLSRSFNAYVFPLFKAISQVPVIGWLPLLMLLVGIDEALKFLLIAKAALVPVAVNTCQGIQGVANAYVEVAKVFRFTRWQLLTKVVFPAATAQIWNGLRYGFTHAWLALVVVELLASSEGIGFMIVYGRQLFQLDIVLAAVVVVGVLGYLIDKVLGAAESHLLRWRNPGL